MQHEQGHIVRRFSSLVQHSADTVGNRLNGPLENVAPVHLEEVPAGSNQFRSCGVQSATGGPVQHAAARTVCSQLVTHQPLSGVTGFEDDGTGIPQGERTRIFDRGARLDTGKPGTGLGLAIVRDVAEIYGGTVDLGESEDLGGLLVRLSLPRAG